MHRPLFPQAAGLVVAACGDGGLRVWRISDGACLRTLEGHHETVRAVADVGGGRVASGSGDGTLRVWDALSGEQLQEIDTRQRDGEDDDEVIEVIAALPGGRIAMGYEAHGEIQLWQMGEGGGAAGVLVGHEDSVNCLVVLGGIGAQLMLASASADDTVRLWDVDARTCAAVLKGHGCAAWSLADLGGGLLMSGDGRGALRVWDVGAAACLATVEGEDDRGISSLCLLADGRIASGEEGGPLRIWKWDAAGKALTQEGEQLDGHTGYVFAVVPVGAIGAAQQLLSGSFDSTLRLWGMDARGAWMETAALRGQGHSITISVAVVRVVPQPLPLPRTLCGPTTLAVLVCGPTTLYYCAALLEHAPPGRHSRRVVCTAANSAPFARVPQRCSYLLHECRNAHTNSLDECRNAHTFCTSSALTLIDP